MSLLIFIQEALNNELLRKFYSSANIKEKRPNRKNDSALKYESSSQKPFA